MQLTQLIREFFPKHSEKGLIGNIMSCVKDVLLKIYCMYWRTLFFSYDVTYYRHWTKTPQKCAVYAIWLDYQTMFSIEKVLQICIKRCINVTLHCYHNDCFSSVLPQLLKSPNRKLIMQVTIKHLNLILKICTSFFVTPASLSPNQDLHIEPSFAFFQQHKLEATLFKSIKLLQHEKGISHLQKAESNR